MSKSATPGIGARVGAGIVDALIVIGIPALLMLVVFTMFVGSYSETTDSTGKVVSSNVDSSGSAVIGCLVGTAVVGALIAAYLARRQKVTGQTPGKRMFNIEVGRDRDGRATTRSVN